MKDYFTNMDLEKNIIYDSSRITHSGARKD